MSEAYQEDAFWISKLKDARGCLQYYKLKHIDKVLPKERNLDMELGTAVHLGVEEFLRGEDGIEIFEMYWESIKNEGLKGFRYTWEDNLRFGQEWLRKFKKGHLKDFKAHKLEERMFAYIGAHKFEGTADFIGWYKGVPSIIDFKTSSQTYIRERTISDEQMPVYAHLIEKLEGFKVEQIVHFVFVKGTEPKIQTPITYNLTTVATDSIVRNVTETCDDLLARKSYPRNPDHCVRGSIVCPAFSICHGKKE